MTTMNNDRKMYFLVTDFKSGSVVDTLYFPYIPPFHFGKTFNIKTYDSVNGKQFSSYGGYNLEIFSFSVEFPTSDRSYSDAIDGMEFYSKVDKYIKNQSKFTLMLTNPSINMDCYIEKMLPRIDDKTFDVTIDFELIERNEPQFLSWTPKKTNVNSKKVQTSNGKTTSKSTASLRNSNKNKRYYTVKHNDNLYDIAVKFYKNGSKYKIIKNNAENIAKYPSLKKNNIIYTGWTLVIP